MSSFREMPEYKNLVCSWSAMLRALQGDERRKSISKGDQRQDTVTQRVLLRMLVTAVKLEVTDAATEDTTIVDPDLADARQAENGSLQTTNKKKPTKGSSSHEELTLALLRALPGLLTSFKSETSVLQSLTTLPQYFRKCKLWPLNCLLRRTRSADTFASLVSYSSKCLEPFKSQEGVSISLVQPFGHLSGIYRSYDDQELLPRDGVNGKRRALS